MKIKIDINCDNAAFFPCPGHEIARILNKLADNMSDMNIVDMTNMEKTALWDINGNKIGNVMLTEGLKIGIGTRLRGNTMADMTEQRMRKAGEASRNIQWTDQEVLDQIEALRLTMAYLNGRKDAWLIVNALHRELQMFEGFQKARNL